MKLGWEAMGSGVMCEESPYRKDFECILPLAYLLQRGLLVGKMTLPKNPLVCFKAFHNTSFDG